MSISTNYGFYVWGIMLSKGLINSGNDWVLSLDFGRYTANIIIWKGKP